MILSVPQSNPRAGHCEGGRVAMAEKVSSARTAVTTKKAKKSGAVGAEKQVKAQTAEAKSAGAEGAKKRSVPKSKKAASPAPSRAKGAKKVKRQSLAQPAGQSVVPPPTAMMGLAAPEALVVPLPPLESRRGREMGVVAGTVTGKDSPTCCIDAGATDLCEIVPSGRIAVAGDTWKGPRAAGPEWSPSLALHVSSLAGAVKFDKSFGWRNLYEEGWRDFDIAKGVWGPDIGLPTEGRSQLPAGTVQIGNKEFLLVTRTLPGLVAQDSRLVEINTERPRWPTVAGSERPASHEDFNQTQISGCLGPDNWVYIVADDFHRQKPVVMYRCRPDAFTNRDSWQGWGMVNGDPRNWWWGQPPEPLSRFDLFGELSLRVIDGKYVLSAFNDCPGDGGPRRIEVHVADPTNDPNIITQILRRADERGPYILPWATVVDELELPNLYGGYIVPGSTLERMRILVSQWVQDPERHCGCEFPYDVREYEINLKQ